MLTKTDIAQIRKVVREEVEAEVKDSTKTLESEIRLARMQIQNEINDLDDRMKNAEIRLDVVGKDVKDTQKRVKKIEKFVDIIARNYDYADVKIEKRVRRIEQHLAPPHEN